MKRSTLLLISLLGILLLATSCEPDEPVIPEPEVLPAEVLDCTYLEPGNTVTLEDRNNAIDYIIDCQYGIGGDLIIKPGVTIQFGTDAGIKVTGTGSIQALGVLDNQVVLTGNSKVAGEWKGIFIQSNNKANKIEYTKIEYAGGGSFNSNDDRGGVIIYSNTFLNMNNTTITNSETYGLNAVYGGCELELEDNTIKNCDIPFLVKPNYVDGIVGGNYTGNQTDAIQVANGFITIDATYRDLGVPYHALARIAVNAGGGKLTLQPGVAIEFGLDGSLEINEGASGSKPSLIAVGTAQDPITLTGVNKVSGAWQGVYFDTPSPLNEIGFATIEYASNPSQGGAIANWAGTVLNVHDVTFKDIQHCAILSKSSASVTTSNLSYINVGSEICPW